MRGFIWQLIYKKALFISIANKGLSKKGSWSETGWYCLVCLIVYDRMAGYIMRGVG